MINPIIDWSDSDVWAFLKYYGCKSNPLYQCGFCRIGCIGCPMSGKHRYAEFRRYPIYKLNYIKAFDRMLANLKKDAHNNGEIFNIGWQSGEDVFRWWMGENIDQLRIDDEWWII